LNRLHVAQQEEFEAQVGFLPFDIAEVPLHPDDLSPDDLSHNVDQGRPPTPSKESISVDAEASLPPQETVSDADRLAESIRKVEDMRQQEERDRQAKQAAAQEKVQRQAAESARSEAATKLRLAQEERQRIIREAKEHQDRERVAQDEVRKREEDERLGRERVAQEQAAAKLKEVQQTRKWKKASSKETNRCRTRDRGFCQSPFSYWSPTTALERFLAVCEEFDTITFSKQQPLVFENVPWPVLHRPDSLDVSTIDWSAVEGFFRQFRGQLLLFAYKDMVEKTHRRFHPDRWSSRGILATVFDDGAREKIREAGNIVSQAITPIWCESKNLQD
jgi:hypothetical protein